MSYVFEDNFFEPEFQFAPAPATSGRGVRSANPLRRSFVARTATNWIAAAVVALGPSLVSEGLVRPNAVMVGQSCSAAVAYVPPSPRQGARIASPMPAALQARAAEAAAFLTPIAELESDDWVEPTYGF